MEDSNIMIKTIDGHTSFDGTVEDLLYDFLAISIGFKDLLSKDLPRDASKNLLHALIEEEAEEEDKVMIDISGFNKIINDLGSED